MLTLYDIFASDNTVSYNIKVAEIFGVNAAIYINELININSKAIRKEKMEGIYFTLDREYIFRRTFISEKDQLDIEERLSTCEILKKINKDSNQMSLDIGMLTSILLGDDQLIKNVEKLNALSGKKTKKETATKYKKDSSYKLISTTNGELRSAYYRWIDAMYEKEGWLSADAIKHGQELVDQRSNRDLDLAIAILNIAAINGYRDIQWAINSMDNPYINNRSKISQAQQTLRTDVLDPNRKLSKVGF